MGAVVAPSKYSVELQQRAMRMALDAALAEVGANNPSLH